MWRAIFLTYNSLPLGLVRLALGIVMFPHGCQKMLGWFGGAGFTATMAGFGHRFGAPLAFLAICAEFFGGLGLILGFLSRIAAFGVLCNMVVAIATVNYKFGLFINWGGKQKGEGIEYHILAIAMALAVIIGGGGAFSIDGLLGRTESRAVENRRQAAEGPA